ncbi:MAG: hypothetical protein BroJett041_19250 [Candidatus Jettenia caeni]|nr:MAG: hypothetical protein BroJett041_19250 [Candidatus Jettenia caeni]GJQ46354.1 MAG: hypothetical protein JETCAE04_21080 [Candidatus Jettenia caeni]
MDDLCRKRVELYLEEEHKSHLDKLELKTQGIPKKQSKSNGQDTISGNVFHKEGDSWTIQYNSKPIRINHRTGFEYIAYLLENKDRDFYLHEVMHAVNKEQFQAIRDSFKSRQKEQDDFHEIDVFDENITVKKLLTDCNEKLRKRVSKNIKDALDNIKKYNNDLWKHLNSSVNTGKHPVLQTRKTHSVGY